MFAKSLILAGIAVLLWSVVPRPSGAHGHKVVYRVKAYDTLWTIASRSYGGDVSGAIWRIEQANHMDGAQIAVGQILILP